MLYNILKPIAVLILKILFHLKVKGKEYVPEKGGFILASNHISYLDPVVLGVASPRKLSFMAKQELFCNPLFSWFISKLGAFPVKRDSVDLSALKEAMTLLREGKVLVLFPEGSRRFDTGSNQPYPGIGFLVTKLNVPVIPCFIKGTDACLPLGAKFIRLKHISVHFGKRIYVERRLPYQDIAELVMENIRQL